MWINSILFIFKFCYNQAPRNHTGFETSFPSGQTLELQFPGLSRDVIGFLHFFPWTNIREGTSVNQWIHFLSVTTLAKWPDLRFKTIGKSKRAARLKLFILVQVSRALNRKSDSRSGNIACLAPLCGRTYLLLPLYGPNDPEAEASSW